MNRITAIILGSALLAASAGAEDQRHGGREGGGDQHEGGSYHHEGGGYRGGVERFSPPPPPREAEMYAPPRRPNSLGADWREQQEEARSGVRRGEMAPLGQVIAGIGHRTAGRPLDAGIEYEGGRPVYRVRWITDRGRRVDYLVDAATGAILSEH